MSRFFVDHFSAGHAQQSVTTFIKKLEIKTKKRPISWDKSNLPGIIALVRANKGNSSGCLSNNEILLKQITMK